MVAHLETEHRKMQVSRNYCLDDYVLFRCGHCVSARAGFEPENVHTWAAHFGKADSTVCEATIARPEVNDEDKVWILIDVGGVIAV